MSRWLVFDTSCPVAVVGVVDVDAAVPGGRVLSEIVLSETRLHAERLPAAVDDALRAAGGGVPVGVAVGTGPGSFIGVRTGLAYAKGLCRAWSVPLVGLPTLPAVALSEDAGSDPGSGADNDLEHEVTAVIDARRGERYLQAFVVGAGRWRSLGEPVAVPVADVAAHVRGRVVGVGVGVGVADGDRAASDRVGPSVTGLLRVLLAGPRDDQRATLLPLYVRGPDAKLPTVDPARHRPVLDAVTDGDTRKEGDR